MTPTELKSIRERLEMTQAQFAEALGFAHRQRVTMAETGREPISRKTELLIAAKWPREYREACDNR